MSRRHRIGALAGAFAAMAAVVGLRSTVSSAGPPPAPPAAPPATAGGYWLSAELVGAPDKHGAAIEALARDIDRSRSPTDAGPPAAFVGGTRSVQDALQWVGRHAFAASATNPEPNRLAQGAAPVPGGPVLDAHGVFVGALIVSGATTEGGLRPIAWPKDQTAILPPSVSWTPAALAVGRAPLFAAPAPRLPPAVERHATVARAGGLFILGWLDRCDAARDECMRWAQVIARDGDAFVPGYLPAYLLTRQNAWTRGAAALPRAQLIRSGTKGSQAQWLLVARDRHGAMHRKRIASALVDGGFPNATLTVEGDWATIEFDGAPPTRLALDATMDLRRRN